MIQLQGWWEGEAQGGGGEARATDTEVAGSNQGEGNAGSYIATYRGVGAVPFQSQLGCKTLEKSVSFPAEEPISGGNKGNEVTAVVGASAGVPVLLDHFARTKCCPGCSGAVSGTIQVHEAAVNDTILGTVEEAADHDITTLMRECGRRSCGGGWSRGRRWL